MDKVIHWFRGDLRLSDNCALLCAFNSGDVLPIFILDEEIERVKIGRASAVWLHHSLNSLNKSLNGHLKVFRGSTIEIFKNILSRHDISTVCWNICYEPWRIEVDKGVKDFLINLGITVKIFNSSLLIDPWKVLKDDGTYYKVFTPFYKKVESIGTFYKLPVETPDIKLLADCDVDSLAIKDLNLLKGLPWENNIMLNWDVGEDAAKLKLDKLCESSIVDYKRGRDFPALNSVSRLSPHLHFGEISPVQIVNRLIDQIKDHNVEHFVRELVWREFSYYLLYHFRDLETKNFQSKFDFFPWKEDKTLLKAWQIGETGYPIVDAGMRELWQTGYMHNRVRMIVGSFLVKNLLLSWHHGRDWFWDCLLDADLASNSASWQWVAGSGADAAPYFRIFNPILQGQKFDPDGIYTKKFVPELSNVPNEFLFNIYQAPQTILIKAGVKLGENYPKPIVDLQLSRDRALKAYQNI